MVIYDKPLFSGQPPLSEHLPVPRGWLLNGRSTVVNFKKLYVFENRNNAIKCQYTFARASTKNFQKKQTVNLPLFRLIAD